jgi:hypothetical protein
MTPPLNKIRNLIYCNPDWFPHIQMDALENIVSAKAVGTLEALIYQNADTIPRNLFIYMIKLLSKVIASDNRSL